MLSANGEEKFHYLQDHLGSPIRLLGTEQNDTALAYDEFGVPVVGAGQNRNNPFGFTGYQMDDVSGLYFAQNRYYAAGLGRFGAEDTHWNAENMIYGDNSFNRDVPNIFSIQQSANLYAYVMSNPLSWIDRIGAAAGDAFDSLDDAVINFGKTQNSISIQENWEYGTYFYSWGEEEKKKYSYTDPKEGVDSGHVLVVTQNPPIPTGKKWEGVGHTHGAWSEGDANTNFSLLDIETANNFKPFVPLFVVLPSGEIKKYTPPKHVVSEEAIDSIKGTKWKLPHDKNHPDAGWHNFWSSITGGCDNCFEYQGDC